MSEVGRVEGNVRQRGNGGALIRGWVGGSVMETGALAIVIDALGSVNGNIDERGEGFVQLVGRVGGNAYERDSGNMLVSGRVAGNVREEDDGECSVLPSATIGGNLDGDC